MQYKNNDNTFYIKEMTVTNANEEMKQIKVIWKLTPVVFILNSQLRVNRVLFLFLLSRTLHTHTERYACSYQSYWKILRPLLLPWTCCFVSLFSVFCECWRKNGGWIECYTEFCVLPYRLTRINATIGNKQRVVKVKNAKVSLNISPAALKYSRDEKGHTRTGSPT